MLMKNSIYIKDNLPNKYNQLIYLQTKHIPYIQNFPEIIHGLPKRDEYPWKYLGRHVLRGRFIDQVSFLKNYGGPFCPLYLPNEDLVTSVEQTQEFFR